jgi:predicted DNA-binding antitoxin AbrB/MazE fold protein
MIATGQRAHAVFAALYIYPMWEAAMKTETIEAVFEKGVFHVLRAPRIPLRNGQRVRLVVETAETPDSILALAAGVYEGLSPQDVAEVEQIALRRQGFFGDQV